MVCTACIDGYCGTCKKRNAPKDYQDCDCQHRVPEPNKMRPEGWMTQVPADRRFAYLDRVEYSMVEIAFMLGLTVRHVRSYTRQDSKTREGEKLLPATKAGGQYVVLKEDLAKFLNERYGQ